MENRVETFHTSLRPNCESFLKSVAQFYEVVLWTASDELYASAILASFENDVFVKKLFRRHCDDWTSPGGKIVYKKDLNRLGRDLCRVILIDDSCDAFYPRHSENVVLIPPWCGSEKDKCLFDLQEWLLTIYDQKDVIESIVHYKNKLL